MTAGATKLRMFIGDPRFWKALRVTFVYVFVSVPIQLTFALLLALVLNRGVRELGETESQQAGMFFKPSMFYSVAADSEHPEEAAMFIDYLVNETAAAEILLSDRGLPSNLEVREAVAGELREILERLNDEVVFGRLTVEEAAAQFMSEASSAVGS